MKRDAKERKSAHVNKPWIHFQPAKSTYTGYSSIKTPIRETRVRFVPKLPKRVCFLAETSHGTILALWHNQAWQDSSKTKGHNNNTWKFRKRENGTYWDIYRYWANDRTQGWWIWSSFSTCLYPACSSQSTHTTHTKIPLNVCKCLQDCKRIPTTTHYNASFLLPIEQGATSAHNFFLWGYNFFLWAYMVHLSLLEYCTPIDLQQLTPYSSISLINNSAKNLLKHLLKFSFVCVLL